MILKDVKVGLSGCLLEIHSEKIIRKTAPNSIYGDRLRKQAEKQIYFYNLESLRIRTPEVINFNSDSVFGFDMEYVNGADFFTYFQSISYQGIDSALTALFDFLDYSIKNAKKLSSIKKLLKN